MRLALVFTDKEDGIPHIYVDFNEQQFCSVLLSEYEKVKDIKRAFERTCAVLRRKAGEV